MKVSLNFLNQTAKSSIYVWLRKKKDLLRLLMIVVVEAIFDTKKDCKGVYYGDDYLRCKCKIIRHCDRNGFIYNFMKKIHIVQKGKNIDQLAFS